MNMNQVASIMSLGPPRKKYDISHGHELGVRLQRWVWPTCLADVPLIRDIVPAPAGFKFNMIFYDMKFDLFVRTEGAIYCRNCDDNDTGEKLVCEVSVH